MDVAWLIFVPSILGLAEGHDGYKDEEDSHLAYCGSTLKEMRCASDTDQGNLPSFYATLRYEDPRLPISQYSQIFTCVVSIS